MKTGRTTILAMGLLLAAVVPALALFSGGDGSATNAYLISTPADLNNIRSYKGSLPSTFIHYRQTADIDLSGYPNWQPIGTNSGSTACVHYDGDGFSIANLNISRSTESNVGLFGHLSGSVRNLALTSGGVSANSYVGAIAGVLLNGSISNCASRVSVGGTLAGGLVGLNQNGTLRNVSVRDAVVSGNSIIGGLVGYAAGGVFSRSYSSAVVMGPSDAGGLIGFASSSPTISSCYWDTQASGRATSAGGTGLSTAAMMQRASYSGWDFSAVWQLYHGRSYPYLRSLVDTVANPVLTPGTGEYTGSSVTVTATCATAGATIHYEIGFGLTPSDLTTNTLSPGGTIEVPILETLGAVAWAPYLNPSAVASATYDPANAVAPPTVSPAAGTYPGTNLAVTISCQTADAVLRYTLDGSEPVDTSPLVPPGGGVTIPLPCMLKAKGWREGLNPSQTLEAVFSQMPTVATPAFNPDGGAFTGNTVNVTISCSTTGAVIRYTTDGSEPDEFDPGVSSGASVVVPVPGTLKAKAWKTGYTESLVRSTAYSAAGAVATPTFNPDAGPIASGYVSVTMTSATAGTTLHYTTDGTEPTLSSPSVASGQSVPVPVPGTLKAKAWAAGLNPSALKTASYTTAGVVATPAFSPDGGTGTAGTVNVTLSCGTAGASIHYTTGGLYPTASDPSVASGAVVAVPQPAILKAKAFKTGLFSSPVKIAYFGSFAGGAGTVQDPYRIASAAHLDRVRDHLDAHFVLIADIDLGVSPWNGGAGWIPLGSSVTAFTGTMDGQGHVISNLYVNRPAEDRVGLFGIVRSPGQIRHLGLSGGSVQGKQYVGALVGYSYAVLSNCYATVSVVGNKYVGGLLGANGIGGVCQDSNATGSVAATGTSPSFFGGLVGFLTQSTVVRCYAAGSVAAVGSAGGLAGGVSGSTVSGSYWDTQTSGLGSSAGGSGRTTLQMYQQATFTGWDFADVWRIDEGVDYPRLRAFDPVSSSSPPDNWLVRFYGSVAAAPELSVKGGPLLWEYIAGTDPSDPDSLFAVTDADTAAGTLTMQVNSVTGRVYRLFSRTSLATGTWQPVGVASNGTGGVLTFVVPAPAVQTFYRLSVELAD